MRKYSSFKFAKKSEISYLSLSKKLHCAFCVRLRVLVPSVSIALAETVLSAQAVQMHNPQIAQLHMSCMLIFQKLAVAQVLRVKKPKVSTVWEKKIAQACLPCLPLFAYLLKSPTVKGVFYNVHWQ